MNPLERYRPIIDDYQAFRAACERPLPSVVRVNTIKTTPARAASALSTQGVAFEAVPWHEGLFRLPETTPGKNWPYAHGWLHGQEEVSALPAIALDPQPGERVWDSCAAPGSKTTQAAALMDDKGFLIGNDSNLGRLSALRHNAERLGVSNLAVTNTDARNYSLNPFDFEEFDRSLVDVPCSCEGTCRKNPDVLDQWTFDHVQSVSAIQKRVLQRAVQATRPGGTVVYSTCTFAPEENEAVLDYALETESCLVSELDLPVTSTSGVTEWDGSEYDPQVQRAHRVYPHFNDTGGFFLAALRIPEEGAT
jgi:NOL1/NOP2/sun family putative RNA methylase